MPMNLSNSVSSVNGVPFAIRPHAITDFRLNGSMKTIGSRVRAVREEKGITRKQLAAEVGIAPSTLSGLELGEQERTTALHRIAESLGVNVRWLETGAGAKYGASEPTAPYTSLHRPMFKTMADAIVLLKEFLEIRDEPADWIANPALLQLAYEVIEAHGKALEADDMHLLTKRLANLRRDTSTK